MTIAVGVTLTVACFTLLLSQRRGAHEFAYAPFTPDLLPWSAMRGFTWEQLWSHVYRVALLGPGLALLTLGLSAVVKWIPDSGFFRRVALVASVASVAATALVMLAVLRGRALYDDELSYRMQAEALGNASLTPPDIGYVPSDMFSVQVEGGYTGKYLPGEALVQVPGTLLGVPALLHLPLLALALYAWYRALRLEFDERLASLATALLAISPMLILTGATGLSQLTSLFCVVCGGLGYQLSRSSRPRIGSLVVAVSFALCLATRIQVALPAFLVIGLAQFARVSMTKQWAALAILVLGVAGGGAAIAAYNDALSGSFTTLPWFLQCGSEHYGFGRVWTCDTFEHTPVTAVENLAVMLVRFNAFWLGLPLSLALLVPWLRRRVTLGGGRLWLWIGAAVLVFEAGYYSTGVSDTGAVYHFELLLPASLIGARVLLAAWERFPSLTSAALMIHLPLGTATFFAEQTWRLRRLVESIHLPADEALARISDRPAIVFHEHWDSEVLRLGWIMDTFPKRFRDPQAPIVTMPRPPRKFLAQVLAAYPGRSCYYYHRRSPDGEPELLTCEQAALFFERGFLPDNDERALWERPTAYNRVLSFDPMSAARRRNREFASHPCVLCCSQQWLLEAGEPVLSTTACKK